MIMNKSEDSLDAVKAPLLKQDLEFQSAYEAEPPASRSKPYAYAQHLLTVLVTLGISYGLFFIGSAVHTDDPGTSFLTPGLKSAVVGDLSELVNVFIGTTNDGHVFPGATVPHGMIKAGMDTTSRGAHAGYDADPKYFVTGFSQLHDDGTGGDIPLSNFKLFPLASCHNFTLCPVRISQRRVARKIKTVPLGSRQALSGTVTAADDYGRPGYFATNLSTDIRVELTATRRTALHRYTFPRAPPVPAAGLTSDWRPRILVDITNDGKFSGNHEWVKVDPELGRIVGGARFGSSFGQGYYKAFVCADFRSAADPGAPLRPVEYGTYAGAVSANSTEFVPNRYGERGAIFTFDALEVLARVGVSFVSVEQACENAEREIPDFDFERVREEARQAWNELLGRFEIAAGERERDAAVLFYSSLYRTHIVPADYTGENPKWDSDEPYFDSLYCNWDTYRTLYPLMSLHDPETFARIARSFIDVQQHEGWVPECRGATLQQHIQGGTDGDPILAEFFIKFQKHLQKLSVDQDALYAALVNDAEVDSPNWDLAGRQANIWKKFGYLPVDLNNVGGLDTRQVSRSLEYAFDDFTISQVARALGKTEDADKYANRSLGYELVWNNRTGILDPETNLEVEGIRGFMQPRMDNGTFKYTDPRHCTVHDPLRATCYMDGSNLDGFYEGGPVVYSQYVPHDTARLIELQGGREAFIRRLDYIFDNGYFDSTNEPSQQIPFMYHYANRPGLSTERSRQAIARDYNTTIYGLPGNDDSGAMGSYVAFYLLGMYPLPGTRQVLISSPYFPQVRIHNPLFKTTTTINARGFEGNPANGTGGRIYVRNVTVDGEPWHSNCYLEWEVFERGSTVDLELTNDRTVSCGNDESALPPSLSTGGYS